LDREAFVSRSRGDPRAWSFVLSPLDGYRLDMPRYARAFMRQVETDMNVKLDWLGACHYDTAHPHVHFLVRGNDLNGREFRIARYYIRHGMRLRASQIATRHVDLGLTHGPERAQEHGLTTMVKHLQQWVNHHSREGIER
jgi:type IV secretory pathway VirD2 relaxase